MESFLLKKSTKISDGPFCKSALILSVYIIEKCSIVDDSEVGPRIVCIVVS